jgi:hypothetical protein
MTSYTGKHEFMFKCPMRITSRYKLTNDNDEIDDYFGDNIKKKNEPKCKKEHYS